MWNVRKLYKFDFKKIFIFSLIIVFLSIITPCFSQDEGNLEGKKIHKIIFKGLRKAKVKDLVVVMSSEEGTFLDLNLVEQDYQNLYGLGYFEDVIISTDKAYDDKTKKELLDHINLIFEFIEKPTVRKIIFKGNKNIPFSLLIDAISLKRGSFIDQTTINTDISAIIEKYIEKGYTYAEVDYELFEDEDLKSKNKADVIFNIKEGIETYVSDIIISGNNSISDFTLKNKMKTKERKFLGLQKGIFNESQFYQDIEELEKIYRDTGFYLIDILEPEITKYEIIEKDQRKELIRISIHIKEGEQFNFGGIFITGNKIISTDDLLYGNKLKKGQVFNFTRYQELLYNIQRQYTNKGYIQTQVLDKTNVDYENKIITSYVEIQESKRSYIEAIYFKGNEKTKDYVLRRTVATEVGEIFNSNKLMSSVISLYNSGFFLTVDQDIQQGSAPGLLVITYILEEQKTAEVRFGVSIPANFTGNGGVPNISIFAEINEKNFLGRELILKGKVEASLYKQGFDFSFDDPWFLSYPWSLGGSFKFYHNWIRLVYRDVTEEDMQSGEDETDVRERWFDEANGQDTINQNYLGTDNGNFWEMGIQNLNFEISGRMGYRWYKYFGVSGFLSCEPLYTWIHDPNGADGYGTNWNYTDLPQDSTFRAITANNGWSVRNKIGTTFSITTTKRLVNPFEGIRYSLNAGYTFGHYDAFTFGTKFTAYFKILDVMFGDWAFQNVIVFNFGASVIMPGFRDLTRNGEVNGEQTYGRGPVLYPTDYLVADGLFSGRGWANTMGSSSSAGTLANSKGFVKLDFTLEYRFPIVDRIVWFAAFIDMINIIDGPIKKMPGGTLNDENAWIWWGYDEAQSYDPMGIDNWYGSFGIGLEFTFPQLPLSFFIVKRFKINYYTGFEWMQDDAYGRTGYLDFVLSIVGYSF